MSTTLLRPHVERELSAARTAADPWRHLERAHILSQPSPRLHTRVHVAMLVAAVRERDLRELVGQLLRVLVGGIGSLAGRYRAGNTGRARVPLGLPMCVPADLQHVLDEAA